MPPRDATAEAKIHPLPAGSKTNPPPSLYAKIIKVAAAMEPLAKRDRNEAGWNFVSIDDYYERAGRSLLQAGVSWVCRQADFSDAGGLLYWTFAFDVYDDAGNVWFAASSVTVPHEYDGPQVAGKVVSYAEKVFMRQLLKLVTGEPDADVSKQVKRAPSPKAVVPMVQTAGSGDSAPGNNDYTFIMNEIRTAGTVPILNRVIETHRAAINYAFKNDPDVHKKIADVRTERLSQLEKSDGL